MKRAIALVLLAALALGTAWGCAPPEEEEAAGLRLWFPVDPAAGEGSAVLDTCPYPGQERSIPALLSALLAGPPQEEAALSAAAPAGTRMLSWSLEDRVANVELSSAYAELAGIELTLADACVTLTLAQLPEVDGVRVIASGGGQSYRDRQVMYPGDVLLSGVEEAPAELTAALYFRREGGDELGLERRQLRLSQDSLPARQVLGALIAGPQEEGLLPLLPPELTVRSVWVEEGVCTADLSAPLLELPEKDRALAARSIEETLLGLDGIERVQLLIEGESWQGPEPSGGEGPVPP